MGWVSELIPGFLKERFSGNSKRLNTEAYPGFGAISSIVQRHWLSESICRKISWISYTVTVGTSRCIEGSGSVTFGQPSAVSISQLILCEASTKGPIALPGGAAYSAYLSKCSTAWMTLVRDGASVVPNVLIGPTREKGESYRDFSERWFKFYGECLEAALTGDPRNISLRPSWVGILTERHTGGPRQRITSL
jgi:hypothetical protein